MKVLITGGSGYLGQFLIVALSNQHHVAYTYLSKPLDPSSCNAAGFRVNLASGEGLAEAVGGFQPDAVINCAAVSQPAACEQDYQTARALNRPERLVQALQQLQEQHGKTALLIHLSTDQVCVLVRAGHSTSLHHMTSLSLHTPALCSGLACSVAWLLEQSREVAGVTPALLQVYNGSRAWWCESDAADPINAYGRSKLEAEALLQQAWRGKFVALRSSLIFGPEPPLSPVGRPLFLQFVRQVLQAGKETTFFVDEYRCVGPVHLTAVSCSVLLTVPPFAIPCG